MAKKMNSTFPFSNYDELYIFVSFCCITQIKESGKSMAEYTDQIVSEKKKQFYTRNSCTRFAKLQTVKFTCMLTIISGCYVLFRV